MPQRTEDAFHSHVFCFSGGLPPSLKPVTASASEQDYKNDDDNYFVSVLIDDRSRPMASAFTILSSTKLSSPLRYDV